MEESFYKYFDTLLKGITLNIVLKIGGHLISSFNSIDHTMVMKYAELLRETYDRRSKWVIVVGGGEIARRYVDAMRALNADEVMCDEVAIMITKANAKLFVAALGDLAEQKIPSSTEELRELVGHGRIIVMGGIQPGQSTIAVAALAASTIKADRLIVATDVEGIYTSDPKIDPSARLLKQVSIPMLKEIVAKLPQTAGKYPLIDNLAISIIERSRIPCIYVNGKSIDVVRRAIMGEDVGTLILP